MVMWLFQPIRILKLQQSINLRWNFLYRTGSSRYNQSRWVISLPLTEEKLCKKTHTHLPSSKSLNIFLSKGVWRALLGETNFPVFERASRSQQVPSRLFFIENDFLLVGTFNPGLGTLVNLIRVILPDHGTKSYCHFLNTLKQIDFICFSMERFRLLCNYQHYNCPSRLWPFTHAHHCLWPFTGRLSVWLNHPCN